jgi:hypothetical protein
MIPPEIRFPRHGGITDPTDAAGRGVLRAGLGISHDFCNISILQVFM